MPSRRTLLAGAGTLVTMAGCSRLRPGASTGDGTDRTPTPPDRRVEPDWQPPPGTWPTGSYDLAGTRYNPHTASIRTVPELEWTYRTGDPGTGIDRVNTVVVAAGSVYVRSENALVAVGTSGETLWQQSRDDSGAVLAVDGRLYEISGSTLAALTPDGAAVWTTDLDGGVRGLVERSGWVYAATGEEILRIHADTGDIVGRTERETFGVTTDGRRLYAGRHGLAAYGFVDGRLEEQWTDESSFGGLAVPSDGRLYRIETRQAEDGPVDALAIRDASDGTELATAWFGTQAFSPAVVDGTAYVGIDDGVVAVDADGTERWRRDFEAVAGLPIVDGETVYVGVDAGDSFVVVAVAADSGDVRWRYTVDYRLARRADTPAVEAVADGRLYVAIEDRVLALTG